MIGQAFFLNKTLEFVASLYSNTLNRYVSVQWTSWTQETRHEIMSALLNRQLPDKWRHWAGSHISLTRSHDLKPLEFFFMAVYQDKIPQAKSQ